MRETAPGALIQRGDPKKNGRVETELADDIAESGDQRVGSEPANGLSAIQTGVVMFARSGGAEGDDDGIDRNEKHVPELKVETSQKRFAVPEEAGESQSEKEIDDEGIDRTKEVIELENCGDERDSGPERIEKRKPLEG